MTFLPEDYEKNEKLNETSNRYMRFEQGENKFRVLGSAITGWEWWVTTKEGGRTPKRVKINEKIDVSSIEEPESIKRFWAFPVWNYKIGKVQILEITQKGIQSIIRGLTSSEDWGSPLNYDLSVIRTGESLDTKYEVIPSPPRDVDDKILKEFKLTHINLNALYDGDDPFKNEDEEAEAESIADDISANI